MTSSGDAIKIDFPGLTPAEAAAMARELERDLLAQGAPEEAVRVARDNAEAMDFGGTLLIGAGILGWEAAKGVAHGLGGAVGKQIYEKLRSRIDAFCQRHRVAAAVMAPGQTWVLRAEYERAATQAVPSDLGTLGVVLLGASAFPHLADLDNAAFARSAAAAKALFTAPGPLFQRTEVLDLFD